MITWLLFVLEYPIKSVSTTLKFKTFCCKYPYTITIQLAAHHLAQITVSDRTLFAFNTFLFPVTSIQQIYELFGSLL